MAGRPSKLTADVIKQLTTSIKIGLPFELACNYAGITYRTFRNWMRKAQELEAETFDLDIDEIETDGNEFLEFFHAIKKAEGEAVFNWNLIIEKAARGEKLNKGEKEYKGNWQAAAWKLERRYPQHYGMSKERFLIDEESESWINKIVIEGLNINAIK